MYCLCLCVYSVSVVDLLGLSFILPLPLLSFYNQSLTHTHTKNIQVEVAPNKDPSLVAAFSEDGQHLAVGAHDGHVRVFKLNLKNPGDEVEVDIAKDKKNWEESIPTAISKVPSTRPFRALHFHPNGFHLLGSGEDGCWRVWALASFGMEEETVLPAAGFGGAQTHTQPGNEVLYTCRCGQFSADGRALYTVHFVKRGPKYVDRRPWLTQWEVEEGEDKRLRLTPTQTRPLGVHPVMCVGLSEDGCVGVCGDSEGNTMTVSTEGLKGFNNTQTQPNMHNFGVTALSIAPSSSTTPHTHAHTPTSSSYLVASTSGDKTLRLQYIQRPSSSLFSSILHSPLLKNLVYMCVLLVLLCALMEACGWVNAWGKAQAPAPPMTSFETYYASVCEWMKAVQEVVVGEEGNGGGGRGGRGGGGGREGGVVEWLNGLLGKTIH